MHDEPIPHDDTALHRQQGEQACFHFQNAGMQWQVGRTKSGHAHLLDRFIAGELRADAQGMASFAEQTRQCGARAGAAFAHQHGLFGKPGHGQLTFCNQRMTRCSQKTHQILCKSRRRRLKTVRRVTHHSDVDFLRLQASHNFVAIAHMQLDLGLGIFVGIGHQQAGQPVLGGGHRTHAQGSQKGARIGIHVLAHLVPQRNDALSVILQHDACFGKAHATAGAHYQRGAQRFFDRTDLDRNSRLCQVQHLGRLRNTAQPCNGVKGVELLECCDSGKHEMILALTNAIVKIFNYSFSTCLHILAPNLVCEEGENKSFPHQSTKMQE